MRRLILILAMVGVVAYVPTLWGGFIWDDEQFIQKNVFLTSWSYVDEIFTTNTIAGAGMVSNYYRPLTTLSFLIDRQIWGLTPFWFHLNNMLIHVGAGLVLFLLLVKLGLSRKGAFWIGMIFLVHPIQTEAVAHADTRGDSLYALWLFVGLYLWTWSFDLLGEHTVKRISRWWLQPWVLVGGGVVSYILSFLSKEVGLAGAGLYALVLLAQSMKSTRGTKGTRSMESMEGIKSIKGSLFGFRRQWMGLLVMGLIVGGYVWLRLTVLNFANSLNFHGVQSIYTESLWVRLMTFGKVFWIYIGLLLWPHPLHMERTSDLFVSFNPWAAAMIGLFLVLSFLGWVEFKKKGSLWIWLGSAWYGVMLVPVSGIVPINGLLYEHWLYGPLTGFLLASYGLFSLLINYIILKRIRYLTYGLIALMCVYTVLTWRMNWIWGEPKRFYEYTLRYSETARLHNNLGMAYADEGRVEEAIGQYKRALELAPEFYPHIYHNLGNAYLSLGDTGAAEEYFRQAIELNSNFHLSYGSLVNIYIGQEKYSEALPYVELLSGTYPANIQFQLIHGQILWKLGQSEEAEDVFERVLVMTNYAPEVERMIEGIRGE